MSADSSQTAIFGSQENLMVNFKDEFFTKFQQIFVILKNLFSKLTPYFVQLSKMFGIFATYILE